MPENVLDNGGRADWYFTTASAAQQWATDAELHYRTSNTRYTQQPSIIYKSKINTPSFSGLPRVLFACVIWW